MAFVYLIKEHGAGYHKIGYTGRRVEQRLDELRTACPHGLEIVHRFRTNNPTRLEAALHNAYSHLRVDGEWFDMTDEDVKSFVTRCESMDRAMDSLRSMGNPFV